MTKIKILIFMVALWLSQNMIAQELVDSINLVPSVFDIEIVNVEIDDTPETSPTVLPGNVEAAPVDSVPIFSRGIEQIAFVPKGQWITGVSISYSQSDQSNYQFLIVENINGDTYSFKVSPMLFYAFQDNMAAGGRLAYSRQRTRLDNANVKIDSETSYDIDNLYSISHTYSAMGAFRNYISLGAGTRFGLINEVQLQFAGGESKICNGSGDDLTGTFERTYSFNIGVSPGLIMFLNNYSALEVNVGVLGFNYSHTKSTTDQVYIANRNMKSANFRINLFSIMFGVAFYL